MWSHLIVLLLRVRKYQIYVIVASINFRRNDEIVISTSDETSTIVQYVNKLALEFLNTENAKF